jgi:hypothetical protein
MSTNPLEGAVPMEGVAAVPVSQTRRMVSTAAVIVAAMIFGLTYGPTAPRSPWI